MRTGGLRLIWSNPKVIAGPHAWKVPKGQPVRWGTRSRGVRFACGCCGASNRSSFGLLVLCGVGWLASSRLSFGFHHVSFFESIKHEKELALIADVLRWVFFFFFYVCCVLVCLPQRPRLDDKNSYKLCRSRPRPHLGNQGPGSLSGL